MTEVRADVATCAEGFQVNTHGELVCTFTDLPDYSCSHCAGLPWEVEPDGDPQ